MNRPQALPFPLVLVLCAVAALPAAAAEPTLDEVLDRHIAARGGDAWKDVEALELRGTYTAFSKPTPARFVRARDGYRAEISWNDHPVTMGWDGENAWWINEMYEMPWPVSMSGQDLVALQVDLDFPNALFVARERGYELELDAEAEFEGQSFVAISLKRPSGQEETWYLDPDTWLETVREAPASEFGRPDRQITYFDDFRPVDGLMIPFYQESQWYTRTRMLEVSEVTVDPPLDARPFDRPAPPGMDVLVALAGDWKVRAERRPNPAAPWTATTRTSSIAVRLSGALVEESYTTERGTPVVTSMTFDPMRSKYRFTSINETFPFLDVLEGAMDADGRIVVDNLASGTSLPRRGTETWTRFTLRDLGSESFVVEGESSRDGGETWIQDLRWTYVRPDAEFPEPEETEPAAAAPAADD